MVAVSLKKDFFQAEDGIRDPDMSRGLGDVYKRQLFRALTEIADEEILLSPLADDTKESRWYKRLFLFMYTYITTLCFNVLHSAELCRI